MRSILLAILNLALLLEQTPEGRPMVQVVGVVTDVTTGKPIMECLVEQFDKAGKRWALVPTNSEGRYAIFVL